MNESMLVGGHYRNPTGAYEIIAIDGMWATVRYEDGTEKRHLIAALQIHWENNQADAAAAAAAAQKSARAPRQRAPKPPAAFAPAETSALIAAIIRRLCADTTNFATRQEIVDALLADPVGLSLVEAAHKQLFYRTPEWIAGSMLDQFGKDLTAKNGVYRDQFDREQIENVWAYRPRMQ